MPVSVNAALRESLAGSAEPGHNHHHHHSHQLLQSQIASATKHLVLKTIEYEEYPENFLTQNDSLKSKYILLSSSSGGDKTANGSALVVKNALTPSNGHNGLDTANGGPVTPKKDAKNELPQPKRTLFAREKIRVGWKGGDRKWQVGAGFVNVGNTCYLNSTLQALLHVPAMANWLASDTEHREKCGGGNNGDVSCTICAVAKTLLLSQSASHAVKPYAVYSRLRSICKHMVVGRQEDAHEFLRYLMEAMEKAFMERFPKHVLSQLDQYSKETTPLNQILGFYLRSSVRCLSCNHVSITFQHFEDLLLDIRKSNTVDEALQGYFAREKLEDMDYTCSGCKKKVSATKQFNIERPPVVLCIQLKRFTLQGNKLNKHVSIKPKLDLTPYVRKVPGQQQPQSLTYRLVSMVTHLGSSQHCGHYTAIGLTESGAYYQFDDSSVYPIALQNVLQTNGYIIFYELESAAMQRTTMNGSVTSSPSNVGKSLVTNGGEKLQVNGNNGNGSHVNGGNGFIGPVLPPTTLTTVNSNNNNNNNKERSSLFNGNGSSSASAGGGAMVNGGTSNGTTVTTTTLKKAEFKKYPSAEHLFKSPSKQAVGETSKATNGGGEKTKSPQIQSPRSLVPYNSNMSSDDEEEEVENENKAVTTNGESSPAKQVNGHFTPYVKTNSGVWKVCSTEGENNTTPTKKENGKSPWKNQNGNGLGGHQNGGSAKVLNEMLKQDHSAYGGAAVSTWAGGKSSLEKETSVEKNLKRSFDRKTDDEEMDRGHVKKLKLNQKVGRDNPGFNPFQEQENKNNQGGGGNGSFRPFNRHNNNQHNGQRADWVNNGRGGGGGGMGQYKPKFQYRPGGGGGGGNRPHNNNHKRPRQNNNFNGNRKFGNGNNRFKGGFQRNHHHRRPNN